MFSMTGYGKGEYREGGIELTVEIKTVNNRYLDVSFKSPKIFIACEEPVRRRVREQLTRGHADIFVNFVDKREKPKTLYVDENAARGWAAAAAFTGSACKPESSSIAAQNNNFFMVHLLYLFCFFKRCGKTVMGFNNIKPAFQPADGY